MEFVSVKLPKDKSKFVRLLKAEKIREGDYGATDAQVIGEALEFSYENSEEFAQRHHKGNVDEVLKFAGCWKMSGNEAKKFKAGLRKWRAEKRESAW